MNSNNVQIVDAVRAGGSHISKKEIAANTGMAWGTMHKTVDQLLQRGILFSLGGRSAGPGRPSIPLSINPNAAFWCGIDVGSSTTSVIVCDLNFRQCYTQQYSTPRYKGKKSFLTWLAKIFAQAQKAVQTYGRLKALGLSVSGNVDSEQEIIVSGGNFGIHYGENIPVAEFADRIRLPVHTISTQTAAVCAEYHFGEFAGCSNLVTIGLGVGIGSGVIANHLLLISHPKRPVGYIGHILIPGNKHKCTCGFTGCLEAFSGGEYLKKVAAEQIPSRKELHDAAMLDRAAGSKDPDAVRIMTTAASYNAAGIAAMIQLYAPEAIVFSGGQVRADGFLFQETLRQVRCILPEERRDNCRISISRLGKSQSALGAARLAYEKFF